MEIAGAILAGGKSTRFGGAPKGLVRLPSSMTLVERLLAEFAFAGIRNVAICSDDCHSYGAFGRLVLPDRSSGFGPLAGIESALAHFAADAQAVVFLACDLPFITSTEIKSLIAAWYCSGRPVAYAETPDFVRHPLCSVVHIDVLDEVRIALLEKRLSVIELWERLAGEAVYFHDALRFDDVDSPDDMKAVFAHSNA